MCVQDSPTIMQPDLSATIFINCGMNAHTMLEVSARSGMQDNHLVMHMQKFKPTDKSKSILHPYDHLIIILYFLIVR
jgi:hypothetical protein